MSVATQGHYPSAWYKFESTFTPYFQLLLSHKLTHLPLVTKHIGSFFFLFRTFCSTSSPLRRAASHPPPTAVKILKTCTSLAGASSPQLQRATGEESHRAQPWVRFVVACHRAKSRSAPEADLSMDSISLS